MAFKSAAYYASQLSLAKRHKNLYFVSRLKFKIFIMLNFSSICSPLVQNTEDTESLCPIILQILFYKLQHHVISPFNTKYLILIFSAIMTHFK